ncbi:MAG: GerMN domain-containing protein [Treponema sp.]|nr:GerMN domain-containing protein [Treponema sp.]
MRRKPSYSSSLGSDLARNLNSTPKPRIPIGALLFWVVFAIIMFILFMVNKERISTTIRNAPFPSWLLSKEQASIAAPESTAASSNGNLSLPAFSVQNTSETLMAEAAPLSVIEPSASAIEESVPIAIQNLPEIAAPEVTALVITSPQTLYFIQIDQDGTILRSRITRTGPSSNSPLLNALQTLINGPSSDEQRQGLISLIPERTRILSVNIRGETAYIDMSEEFQYNSYGREGYAAQLHQIVWTATEFSSVKSVQLLIEGRRVDWLGEGIWIGSPLNRTSL